jgi:hypothetical protein
MDCHEITRLISVKIDAWHGIEHNTDHAPVAQLDRVSVSEAEGHRFDSCRVRHR